MDEDLFVGLSRILSGLDWIGTKIMKKNLWKMKKWNYKDKC